MKKIAFVLAMLAMVCTAVAQNVSNFHFVQEGKIVKMYYDLDEEADVSIYLSTDGGRTFSSQPIGHVSGDVGQRVPAGKGKCAVWDVLSDRGTLVGDSFAFKVKANSKSYTKKVFQINENVSITMIKVDGLLDNDTSCVHTFYLAEVELTCDQWQAVMGKNSIRIKDENEKNLPVIINRPESINLFIGELNRLTGKEFRLPTEKEWLFAARGGRAKESYPYPGGYASDKLAWTSNNSGGRTHPVGEKSPNSLGIYDMCGNVAELVSGGKLMGGDYDSRPVSLDDASSNSKGDLCIGIRLAMSVSELPNEEQKWDDIISKNLKRQERKRKNERYWKSFTPIVNGDASWTETTVGYDFKNNAPVVSTTISPGSFYLSALSLKKDCSFYSAGLSFCFIDRLRVLVGAAYTPIDNIFGFDFRISTLWDYFGVSGGAMIFPNNMIMPHAEISLVGINAGVLKYGDNFIPTIGVKMGDCDYYNISSVYGYDFKDKTHIMGLSCSASPFYVSAMYQTDKSFHFSLGGANTIEDFEDLGYHVAVAYSTEYKFGLDLGLTLSIIDDDYLIGNANISAGMLLYKDKILPTIGVGGVDGLGFDLLVGLLTLMIWGSWKLSTSL